MSPELLCMNCWKAQMTHGVVCKPCLDLLWDKLKLVTEQDEADEFYAELKARLDERAPA